MTDYTDVPAFVQDFLSYMSTIKGKSSNTIREYHYDLRNFLRFLKLHFRLVPVSSNFESIEVYDIDIEFMKKIDLSDLYAYMNYLELDRSNKVVSRARKVASIRSLFNYLTVKAKILDQNPAKELESPKLGKRIPKYLNVDESKQLLNAIDGDNKERDYAIITLFLNCGLRLSELISININQIKDDKLTVIGKGNKERTVYLNHASKTALNEYMRVRPREGVKDRNALFLSERKKRISPRAVQYIVKKYLAEAGLDTDKITPHKLRHTAATLMYQYGNVDIRSLQEILGHESVATTEIYTHTNKEQLKDAVNKNPLADFEQEEKDD
ncbi:MAG: tyrosine recombinase XerC [Clostridia bacterium]|nr:tyrosine recombinase XerC [Clostridia bacterium]